ncbi:ribosome-associated toxin RatA of RatAB toxin-antitoxin module [Friedmanniella endophytica]|uniref:Ribosome-associated toxin RatA of RatAB toxin-antitoxin module n=1 Tax=Microlunatus kandeliicorticis TaxID=1759536 RepID=A0A7W3ISE7_9ACTN|nr:SRPBCC family protein [Microlunatus kandeliicorticis]MBA8794343.1 ribosome-associated toxin RatA of RatAB toxin-antitoxin module [Microlunatus kandeliicorticis]
MADQTSSSIDIDAAPAEVMAVIADLERYPEWVDSLKSATVLSERGGRAEQVRMVLEHPVVKDTYTLAYDWDGDREVRWHLVEGQLLKAMDGSYALTPAGRGTRVTYTLAVDLSLPMLGMIKRKAEKTIIDGALKGLKKRVEG